MAFETLKTFKELNINGLASQAIFANEVVENMYQTEIELNEKGCTRKFSNDTAGSVVRISQILPLPLDAREIGAKINGGNFPYVIYQPTSREFSLELITVIDDMVDIPQVRLDMIPVDVMQKNLKNISDKVVVNANAIKIAARVFSALTTKKDGGEVYITEFDEANDKMLDKVNDTIIDLDNGDADFGLSSFPRENSIFVIKAAAQKYLMSVSAGGVLSLGGANYGYNILKEGGVSEGASVDRARSGYIGTIFGVDFHFASEVVWKTADKYLGMTGATADIYGYCANATGNFYGLAANSQIKTIDSPNGVGVRLQPLYRMGAANPIVKSNSYLVKAGFTNPYELKDIFTGIANWNYRAPASRQVLGLALTSSAATKLTANVNAGVSATLHYVITDTAIASVGDFVKAWKQEEAVKGTLTAGSESTIAGWTAGKYATVVAGDVDGTFELVCKVA